MHTIKLNINDRAFDKVQYFLNNLPKEDVEIISDDIVSNKLQDSIDFSDFHIESFKSIKDPVKWQQSIRSEWDR